MFAADLRSAALASLVLVVPFAIMEGLHTTLTTRDLPGIVLLFGLLWLLPAVFLFLAMSIMRSVRMRTVRPVKVIFSVAIVLFLAVMWGSLLVDQLPCFLGVPNCD